MFGTIPIRHDLATLALAACRPAGGNQKACIMASVAVAQDHGSRAVGNEDNCRCGSILRVGGVGMLTYRACRGRSGVPGLGLQCVEREA